MVLTSIIAVSFAIIEVSTTPLFLIVGAIAGWFITPDADVNGSSEEERRIPQPFRFFWKLVLYPYSLLFRHRGISHWIVVGTFTRIFYLLIVFTLVVHPQNVFWWYDFFLQNKKICMYVIVPWIVQDTVHYFYDIVSTYFVRKRNRQNR